MKISVILAHPRKKSFNHAIAAAVLEVLEDNGHDVYFHDLYEEQFDPLLPAAEFFKDAALPPGIEKHCREIAAAEGIVVVHPNWWGQPPAILTGWIGRVLRPGVAYEFLEGDQGEGVPYGLLRAASVLVFNTSNTNTEREINIFGDPLETIWKNCVSGLCGIKTFYRKMLNVVIDSSVEQRKKWLREVRQTVGEYFPENRS